MDWLKRNLLFVIGGVAALVLMGLAGWYCYAGWSNNSQEKERIATAYGELNSLYAAKPAPGDGAKVDNIKLAQEQQTEAQRFLQSLAAHLKRIPAIPSNPNLTGPQYSAALQETISQLQREATNSSVILPPGYKFSFGKQATLVTFAPSSLAPLAVQLGEVKAICDILNQAKVNSLDGIRRQRVPGNADDLSGPATDYLDRPSITNDLAVISPYEITFHSFTPELAAVLAGFAQTPYGLIVKAINVEPSATTTLAEGAGTPAAYAPRFQPTEAVPGGDPYAAARRNRGNFGAPVAVAQPVTYAPATKSGLQPFLKEKQLKITLLLDVVKLLPTQK